MKLLLVEDDAQLQRSLKAQLCSRGYAVDSVSEGEEALEGLRAVPYELVILDRRLPDGDGVLRIPELRRARPEVRILMLTALDATSDKVAGLNAGADDYLAKPFALDELLARIRALLRRPGGQPQPQIKLQNLCYEPGDRSFLVDGQPLQLRRRELLILEALVLRARRVVGRQALMDQVYELGEEVQDNALEAHLSRLRARLAALGARVQIHAIRGVGYLLTDGDET